MAHALRSFVAALPRGGSLVIAGHQQALHETRSWHQLEGLEVIQLPIGDDVDFTLWSQDSFLACTDARGSPMVLLPAHDRRRPDALVIGSMATALGIDVARAEFDFEGGNILVGANVILIGADAIGPDIQSRLAGLGEHRAVVSLGTTDRIPDREVKLLDTDRGLVVEERFGHTGVHQPLFHLDAFMTFAGQAEDGRDLVFVGDARMAREAIGPDILTFCDQSVSDQLDDIAEQAAKIDGLAVVRNPLPTVPMLEAGFRAWSRSSLERKFRDVNGIEDVLSGLDRRAKPTVAVRRWRAATQNGAIVFSDGERYRRVLLPTYAHGRYAHLAHSECLNRDIWRRTGFEVIELPDFTPFAAENGSLHCLFKVISSTDPRASRHVVVQPR